MLTNNLILVTFVSSELSAVANIIMDSFYDSNTSWRRLYQLAELNRLQNNFPYVETDIHQMLVAMANNRVVGFVDIDARPCKTTPKLPRPYLSDLCIDPEYRRQGLAQTLVLECESFIQSIPREELFIRVEESNEAAVAMYQKLGYGVQSKDEDKNKGTILILHKSFNDSVEMNVVDDGASSENRTLAESGSEYVI